MRSSIRPAAVATIVILTLTVAQLLVATFAGLDQFAGKGFGYRLVAYPLLMFVVPVAWWLRARARSRRVHVPWTAFALIMTPFLIDVTGNSLDLYDAIAWWDDLNHFVNWGLLCGGLGLLLARLDVRPTWLLVLTITGIGAALAIGWELAEYWTFIRRGVELDTAYTDTLGDEALGTLGALVAALAVIRSTAHRSRSPEPTNSHPVAHSQRG